MKILAFPIALLLALLAIYSQASFLSFRPSEIPFLDSCIQWGINATIQQGFDADPAENIVEKWSWTGLLVNYTFEMGQGGPCPETDLVNISVACPFQGEEGNQIVYFYKKHIWP
jgi:hypothetical protein